MQAQNINSTQNDQEKQNDTVQRTTRNLTIVAISTVIAQVFQLGWVVLLARLLGESNFGIWGVIGSLLAIGAALPECGMGLITLRDVAQRPALSGKYLAATLIIQPILALLGLVILVIAGLLLPYDTPTRILIGVAAISLLVDTLGNMCHNQLLAVEQMTATSVIRIAHIMVLLSFGLCVILSGGGLLGLYLATILAGLFRAGMYWLWTLRLNIRPEWPFQSTIAKYLFAQGWPIAISTFLITASRNLDKVIVLALISDASQVSYLMSAFVIVYGVVELSSSTMLVALSPMMARLARENPAGLRSLVDKFAFLTFVLAIPMAVGISQLSSKLADLLFPGFRGTAGVLQVLIWQAVIAMLNDIYGQSMVVRNRQQQLLGYRLIGLISNTILIAVLVPQIGIIGAAYSALLSQGLILLLLLLEHRPELRLITQQVLRTCLAGVVMGVMIIFLREQNVHFILAGIAGLIVYGGALILFRAFSPEHWILLRNISVSIPIVGSKIAQFFPPNA